MPDPATFIIAEDSDGAAAEEIRVQLHGGRFLRSERCGSCTKIHTDDGG